MPTPTQIVTAQTALNRVELALQQLIASPKDATQQASLASQALRELSTARHALA